MSVLGLLLLILLVTDPSCAADQPVVIFEPNWKKIFTGTSISLTCSAETSEQRNQRYYWYKDDYQLIPSGQTMEFKVELKHAGTYRCRCGEGVQSDPVQLEVSENWVILQAPPYIYEGDTLTLQCLGWDSSFSNGATFYKNEFLSFNWNSIYKKQNVQKRDSGTYTCRRTSWKVLSSFEYAGAFISVHDLFSEPVLSQVQPFVTEGDATTLKCDTRLAPPRRSTTLQFNFYRNEQPVQEFGLSDKYTIQSAQLDDTGMYACEVRTASGTVRKKSNTLSIEKRELFSEPVLHLVETSVMEGDRMTLKCDTNLAPPTRNTTLQFAFSLNKKVVQQFSESDKYMVQAAQLEDSGDYECEVKTESNTVRKKSKILSIKIKQLFTPPKITVKPSTPIKEGAEVTIHCETSYGKASQVLFTFYKNSQSIQNVTTTNTFRIGQAGEEHGGGYQCSAQSQDGRVFKKSQILEMQILLTMGQTQLKVSPTEVAIGAEVTLLCESPKGSLPVIYNFYHNGTYLTKITTVQKRAAELKLVVKSLNMGGVYSCDSYTAYSAQKQPSNNISLLVDPSSGSVSDYTTDTYEGRYIWIVTFLPLVIVGILIFVYRHKMASVFQLFQAKPESTFGKVRPRVGQTPTDEVSNKPDTPTNDQKEYYNVIKKEEPSVENISYAQVQIHQRKAAKTEEPKAEDISYACVQVPQRQGSGANANGHEEYSVMYSAIKCSAAQNQQETKTYDPDDTYQNFSSTDK
ncbi:Fc receptor-like protein 3 isoform X2 [Hyperolius riggenbachi]|uniref:Fc receptor-like protein 3 isoform X2 n=1 Tax=Hyperolius riggenbachi TaxID=752182 RepID=UPI0035A32F7B